MEVFRPATFVGAGDDVVVLVRAGRSCGAGCGTFGFGDREGIFGFGSGVIFGGVSEGAEVGGIGGCCGSEAVDVCIEGFAGKW